MSDRYKSRGRKERTPEQLKVLEMAREKARLVIAERTKIKREMTIQTSNLFSSSISSSSSSSSGDECALKRDMKEE